MSSSADWQTLVDYLGGDGVAGSKMKATGTTLWNSPTPALPNESGFSALPGGYCDSINDIYGGMRGYAYFWSSTESGSHAWSWNMHYNNSGIEGYAYGDKVDGHLVRFVRG